ncbi:MULTISPECIES: leucyl/phenylalanyl-tRNA--protein transferase [Pacificibacter]|uniref:leucyl/phenylalanyl-tRNA--protein transferase n=1 Tax=Pacificibacter TaxID=1042323 RepID=UPI001C09447D|nr:MULTISPECIES: leucyl/phenylalanyl-tRNA--protein transferase [Pacificibacter]MBU2935470.1 leucyl/phenylalanyl-tRNA--protein transferase [Pacificibacter marinus]MDO6613967.1 leucyl/phenylalanyl-tRNA--protein transferase [Pacificibacter sp. 1_MG-2023]
MDHVTLTPQMMLNAYANGVFPMSDSRDDPDLYWVDPTDRGIFPLDGFHISKSLAKTIRLERFSIRFNTNFDAVVEGCADRPETWINDTIFDLYKQLHAMKFCHSLEVYEEDALVGGVYGLTIGTAFFGESMFSRRTDASKVALAYMVARLRATRFTLFDTQFITPHLASLGAIEIPRANYHELLGQALEHRADIEALPAQLTPQDVLQVNGQIS